MNILEKMVAASDTFTKTEKQIFEFIKANIESITRETTESITEKYGFSQPALTRFSKKVGFKGYSELKFEISRFRLNKPSNIKDTSVADAYFKAFKKIDSDIDFKKIISHIKKADKIIVSGYYRSKVSAQLLAYNLQEFNYNSFFMDSGDISRLGSFSSKKDLLIIFSSKSSAYSSYIDDILSFENRPYLILIDQTKTHPLRDRFDLCIDLPSSTSLGYDFFMEANIFFEYFITQLSSKL